MSQNVDSIKLVGFAEFLEKGKLHKYAAEEYERLYFLYPSEKEFFIGLLRNYRASGELALLSERFKSKSNIDSESIKYYALGLMDYSSYKEASELLTIHKSNLNDTLEQKLRIDISLLSGKYDLAEKMYIENRYDDSQYLNLIHQGQDLKHKSPLLAGIFSTIVPGSGRFYTGDYKDGIISLLFIGSTAYQAYRRFKKNGSSSVTGWIYGGISLGFHLGNIYGSVQSAKYYNSKKQKAHNVKVKNYIDQYYSE